MKLTILFDHPYWIGLLEDERDGYYYAARFIFGAESNDEQVYEFVLWNLIAVTQRMTVGIPVEEHTSSTARINPKRQQREIRRELMQGGLSSKAYEAMRVQIEQGKQTRRIASREEREEHQEHRRQVARNKARAKHRGH
ncbi:MAG TPA: YjdF family protein [Phototrophicaceae bacterium]|nr:YjdF family protein [Phototrophicaceae bacterium]